MLASLYCSDEAGDGARGMCGAYDYGYTPGEGLDCAWVPKRKDLECRSVLEVGLRWGIRRYHLPFYLVSDDPVPLPEDLQKEPRDLEEMVTRFEQHGTRSARPASLKFIPVTHLASIERKDGQGVTHLFGAPGEGPDFDIRFFAVETSSQGLLKTTEIPESPEGRVQEPEPEPPTEEAEEEEEEANFEWIDAKEPQYFVRKLRDDAESPPIVQVVAQESREDGSATGMYWIGLEETTRGLLIQKVTVASDGASYFHCNQFRHASTTVALKSAASAFGADLEVQAPWRDSGYPPEPPTVCLVRKRLTWERGRGFVANRTSPPCVVQATPKGVQIGQEGTIRPVRLEFEETSQD